MKQIQPNRNKFEAAKIGIKNFSQNLPHTPSLNKFEEETFFGLMSKNVTGGDMNRFIEQLQKMFYESNASIVKLFKEFKEVYNVLEILDKEYIEKFEKTLNHLEKVSNEANDVAKDNKRIIETLKATIEKLNEFKRISSNQLEFIEYRLNTFETVLDTKLDQLNTIQEIKASIEKYKHFMDIDQLWADVQIHKDQIQNLIDTSDIFLQDLVFVKNHIKRIEDLNHIDDVDATWEQVQNHSKEIKSIFINLERLNSFKSKIENITHLLRVDEMWYNLEKVKTDIPNISSNLKEHSIKIEALKVHKDQLNEITHLKDVDHLWNENVVLQKEVIEVKKIYQEFERKNNDAILQLVEKNKMLEELMKSNEVKSNSKITYAYVIGGLAFLLAVVQFVLNFSK